MKIIHREIIFEGTPEELQQVPGLMKSFALPDTAPYADVAAPADSKSDEGEVDLTPTPQEENALTRVSEQPVTKITTRFLISHFRRMKPWSTEASRILRAIYEAGDEGISNQDLPTLIGVQPRDLRSIFGGISSKLRSAVDLPPGFAPQEMIFRRERRGKIVIYYPREEFTRMVDRTGMFKHVAMPTG